MEEDLNLKKRHLLLLLLLPLAMLLTGCSGRGIASSWPGITVDEGLAYIASGQQLFAVNPVDQRVEWQYPNSPESSGPAYYAAPAVTDGLLVVGGYDNVLYGIDRNTLRVEWNFHRSTGRYIGSPVMSEGMIFVATAGNELFALDEGALQQLGSVDKSDELRRTQEEEAVLWQFMAKHGMWAAPLVTADAVYVTSLDHYVYALEIKTGREIWTTQLPGAMAGTPVLSESEDGDMLYVGNFDHSLYALDAASGDHLWHVESENWIWGRPILAGDKLFFSDLGGYIYAVDPQRGDILWQQQVADAIRGAPAYDAESGRLYVAGRKVANPGNISTRGVILALEAETYKTIWEQPTDEAIYTSPALLDDLLLVTPAQGEVLMQVHNAETGVLQWRFIPQPDNT